MIETRCVKCGKSIQLDEHGFARYICEKCSSPFFKKIRPGEFITNFKEIKVGAHDNAHGRQKVS